MNTSLPLVSNHHISTLGSPLAKRSLLNFIFCLSIALPFTSWSQTTVYTGSTTYTVPAGVTSITVECWGGGGAGGRATTNSSNVATGGGGGGGAYAKSTLPVTSGTTYTVTVAASKPSSTSSNTGNDGNPSIFGLGTTELVKAMGGAGGTGYSTNGNSGNGAGGTGSLPGSIGTVIYAGGSGGTGNGTSSGAGGGGAGSTGAGGNATIGTAGLGTSQNGGNGGAGVTSPAAGNNGSNHGGGGSGARTIGNTTRAGGNGAAGMVVITVCSPSPSFSLTSPTAYDSQSLCPGVAIAPVTYSITNATSAIVNGLPSGLSSTFSGGTLTISGVPTAGGTSTYTVIADGGCVSALTATLSVTLLPAVQPISISGSTTGCGAVTLTAASSNATSYSWSGGSSPSGATNTFTTSGTYTVSAAANTCTATATTAVTVFPVPTAVAAAASPSQVCAGASTSLSSTATTNSGATAPTLTLFSENFNAATTTWTRTNNSTGGTTVNANWTLQPNSYSYTSGNGSNAVTVPFNSNDNSQFYLTNSDAQGGNTNSRTNTALISPALSTLRLASANISFWHYFQTDRTGDTARVEVSTDTTVWTVLATYTSTVGSSNVFVNVTLPLGASQLNQPALYVRFSYTVSSDKYWAIDNFSLNGSYATASYNWTSPAGFNSTLQNPGPVTPSATTTYTVTVTNNYGCTASNSVSVTRSTGLQSTVTTTAASCFGNSNGSAQVTVTGGTAPYTYSWSGGGTAALLTNKSAGTYTVSITDAAGCTTTATATITQPTAISVSASSGIISCNGGSTSVTISAAGGTGALSGTGVFVRTAGTASYTVSDANSCAATTSLTLTQPDSLVATATAGTILCNGDSTSVNVSATGGTAPFSGTGNFFQSAGSRTYTVTDSRGCTSTTSVTLTQPQPLTAVASAPPFCYGGSTTASVTASGGTQPYSYYWDEYNGSTNSFLYVESGDFNFSWYGVNSPGPWTVSISVTDANGCTAFTSVDIYNPDALTLAADANQIQCSGDFGSVTLAPTGGVPPYSFSGSPVIGLTEGTYTYTVTDALGCTATSSATIDPAPDPFSITATVTQNISCFGGSNGVVTLSSSGGLPTVSYNGAGINNPFSGIATTLSANTYTITAIDGNGCSATTSVTITEPATAVSASATSGSILCNGGTTSVTISASGGTGAYNGTGSFIQGATTTVYTVSDANGCLATTSVTPSQPSTVSASASSGFILCNGGTASVTITATGGGGSYTGTGAFNQGATTAVYTVSDANGCSTTTSVTLTQPTAVSASAASGSIACNGGTASVTISATGGTGSYTGRGTFNQGAITAVYTVSDANGCSATTSVTLTQPAAVSASAASGSIACNGGTTSVTISASGGSGSYTGTGTFSQGATTAVYTVSDANGCSASTSVTLTSPSSLSASASAGSIACNGGTASVTITAAGGSGSYIGTGVFSQGATTAVYTVSDANSCSATTSVTLTAPSALSASASAGSILCNGGSTSVTITASGGTGAYSGTGNFMQSAGSNTYTVTDAAGCSATTVVTLNAPAALTASASGSIRCNGGTASVSVTAAGGTVPYTGTGSFTRSAGTFTFTVTDANSCSATATITLTQPALLTLTASPGTIQCNGGSASVTLSAIGGTLPYSYSGDDTTNLTPDTYLYTVTDANGCTATASATIAPEPFAISLSYTKSDVCSSISTDGSIDLTVRGGTGTYRYEWRNLATTLATSEDISGLTAGTYTVTVTDSNGCTSSLSITLNVTNPDYALINALPPTAYAIEARARNGGSDFEAVLFTPANPSSAGGLTIDPAGTPAWNYGSYHNVRFTYRVLTGEATWEIDWNQDGDFNDSAESASSISPSLALRGLDTLNVYIQGGGSRATSQSMTVNDLFINGTNFGNYTSANSGVILSPVFKHLSGTWDVTVTARISLSGGSTKETPRFWIRMTGATAPFSMSVTPTSTTHVNCNGRSTGAITVSASGGALACGSSSYNYEWSNGAATPAISNLAAGTYTVTVTDAMGITASTSVTISEPSAVTLSASVTPINCFGGTGSISLSASGGTGAYSFNNTATSNLTPGTYNYTVTDANGCTASTSVNLTQPSLLTATASGNILCNGGTGSLTVTATGGTSPYSGTGSFSQGATATVYTVSDANGCSATTSVTLTEPTAVLASASAGSIACNGGTASVVVSATGGTGSYTGTGSFNQGATSVVYTVSDANGCSANTSVTLSEPTSVSASASAGTIACNGGTASVTISANGGTGSYTGTGSFNQGATTKTYTVSDANGCSATTSVTLTQPTAVSASVSAGTIACNGGTASVTVSATGGTGSYTGTGSFNQGATSVVYTVSDANGCSATTSVTLTEPAVLVASASAGSIACNGGTASVVVSANGGTGSYTGTGSFNQGATSVVYTVSDANGCTATTSVTLTQPSALTASASAGTIACNGDSAPVVVSANGGTGSYTGTGSFNQGATTKTYTVSDANGCSATTSVMLTQPTAVSALVSAGTIACNGGTASVTVSATGGTGTYTGTGSFNQGATSVVYTVSDANGCSATTSVTLTEPAVLVASASAGSIACNGGTAPVTVSAVGGTTAYTGTGTFNQGATTDVYTVSDANGCSATTSVTLTQPAALVASATAGTIACNGGTASVTISANGGTAPYSATGTSSQGATTTVYSVSDANGCSATTSVTLTAPSAVSFASLTHQNALCFGANSGSISASAQGGTGAYSYSLNGGTAQSSGNFNNLTAGTYSVAVSDANGCSTSSSVIVGQPAALTATASAINATTVGGSDGTATVTITGGTTAYSVSWNTAPAQTGLTATGLPAGTYVATVTDQNGCTAAASATVGSPACSLSVSASHVDANCFSSADGSVTATATGASGAVTFTITPGGASNSTGVFTGLTSGTYTVTATDGIGCTSTASATVGAPSALSASASAGSIACNGGNASVTITAAGGTLPYSGTGGFTQSATAVTYTVTDDNGCTATTSVTLTQPSALTASASAGTIACNGGTASVVVSANGGTGSYTGTGSFNQGATTKTYTVSDSNGCSATTSVTLTQPTAVSASVSAGTIACNGGTASVTVSANGGTGSYTGTGSFNQGATSVVYTVSDANGCSATTSVTLTEPAVLVASASAGSIACNGGTASVTVSAVGGTTAYTGTGTFSQSATTTVYTVSDSRGCLASTSVTLTQPAALAASATAGTIACNGGTASVTISAVGGTTAYTGTGTFSQLFGTRTYTVIDANGCSATTSVTLTEPTAVSASASAGTISCNGGTTSVTVSASGGTGSYIGTGSFTLGAGSFTYTVTDASGCSSTTSITISQPAALSISASSGSINCNGGSASVTISANGGTAAYTGTGTFSQSATNTVYSVSDANGCSATTSVTLTQPAALVASASAGTIACNGGTASATISAIGGTTAYTGTGIFNQSFGTTVYTVADANGCSSTTSVVLTQPAVLVASATAGTIACNGGSTSVTVSASGGTGSYTGTGLFTSGAGSFTYTVTDANGCSATTSITISQPVTLTALSEEMVNISCNGGSGSVSISATGGTAPYSGTGNFSQSAGTLVYTVTDANGCPATVSETLTQPDVLIADTSITQPILCFGDLATVQITATGGTEPYVFSSTTTSPSGIFSQAAGASVTYLVTDDEGCTSTVSVILTQPNPLQVSLLSSTDAGCSNNNGSASVSVSGGTAPYSYQWSNSQTTSAISGLAAGTYTVTVTDFNGCTGSLSVVITQALANPAAPGSISGANGVCTNTVHVYSVQNVAGVTYNWTLPAGASGASTSNTITVTYSSAFIGGLISVSATNACGTSIPASLAVSLFTLTPARPDSIDGPANVCGPTVQQYSVPPASRATSYLWIANGGITIISGQGTNTVQVSIPANFGQGTIYVYSVNCIGQSPVLTKTITGIAGTTSSISGPRVGMCAGASATYSVSALPGAVTYTWTYVGNMTITPNGNTCAVVFGSSWTSGTLSVTITNSCGSFTRSATIRSTPTSPGSIYGLGTGVCNSTQTYSTDPVGGATGYTWTVPSGVTVVQDSSGLRALVTFPSGFTSNSAPICVTANNNCGSSTARCFTVTTRPAAPVVTGPATVCKNGGAYSYSTAGSPSATSYNWSLSSAGSITTTVPTTTASANFATSNTGSQQVRCVANNACGASQAGILNVTVNACRTAASDEAITSAPTSLTAFPNPTDGRASIGFTSNTKAHYSLVISDLLGKAILTQRINASEGYNVIEINLGDVMHGIYLVSLRREDGSKQTIRLIVQ